MAALAGIAGGVFFSSVPRYVRAAVPVSAGLLLGVSLFGLLPELAQDLSWVRSVAFFALGFAILTVIDRGGISICGTCAHDHDHHGCAAPLHGFAMPLLVAAGVHSLFDGWALAASTMDGAAGVRFALPLALILHKLPEGLALGALLKNSLHAKARAAVLAALAESLTLVGGAVSVALTPKLGYAWTNYPLAIAGGFFLFLAFHALHGEWKKSPRSAFATGTAGLVVAALLQTGLRSYFLR